MVTSCGATRTPSAIASPLRNAPYFTAFSRSSCATMASWYASSSSSPVPASIARHGAHAALTASHSGGTRRSSAGFGAPVLVSLTIVVPPSPGTPLLSHDCSTREARGLNGPPPVRCAETSALLRDRRENRDEGHDLERERHPRSRGAGAGARRPRAARRALSPGDQGAACACARDALRARRLLVPVARRDGLLRRGAPRAARARARAPGVRAPPLRHGDADRVGGGRRSDDRLGLRAERRQGLRGEASFPRGDGALGGGALGRRADARAGGRPQRRAHRPRRAREGAQARRDRSAPGGAGAP